MQTDEDAKCSSEALGPLQSDIFAKQYLQNCKTPNLHLTLHPIILDQKTQEAVDSSAETSKPNSSNSATSYTTLSNS